MVNEKLWVSELNNRRVAFKVLLMVIMVAGAIFVVNNRVAGHRVYALMELGIVVLSAGLFVIG